MPLLLLLLLTLACLPEEWPEPWAAAGSPQTSAGLTWLGVLLVLGVAAVAGLRVRRLVALGTARDIVLHRYRRWRLVHIVTLFGTYGLALYVLGWGWAVQDCCGGHMPPGGELLVLAPFLVGLVLSWACFYEAERALNATSEHRDPNTPFWGRWAYVGFHVRHNLALVCIPVLLLVAEKAVRHLLPDDADSGWQPQTLAVVVLVFLSVLACIPWILRLVLGLEPFPEGPLRERLLAAGRRLNFRCSNLLLWNTRNGVANAMVCGILPIPRYVVLTDRLIAELTPAEVEAVFGHEVGHVKHRHMFYYLSFLFISLTAVWAVMAVVLRDMGAALTDKGTPAVPEAASVAVFFHDLAVWLNSARQGLAVLPAVVMVGAYIFVVFGFLSRRCERQADLYGCRAVSCPASGCNGHGDDVLLAAGGTGLCPTGIRTFIEALEKVARINGISRDKPGWLQSWQHSTIGRRVRFLEQVIADPALEPRFQRRVGLVKWGLLLGLAGLLVFLGTNYGWANLSF